MAKFNPIMLVIFLILPISISVWAGDLAGIKNYREYSPVFASAGQPTRDQFAELKEEGFERIVYIAFANSKGAMSDEDQLVNELGMDYAQLPGGNCLL